MGKSTISMAIFNSFLYVYQWLNGLNLLKSQFLAGLIPNPLDVGPAQAWPFAATAACRLAGCLLPGTRGTWQYDHGNWRNVIHWGLGMDQYLLIPFLVGWTSIYQLFWGSLGTRVLTHPQVAKPFFPEIHQVQTPGLAAFPDSFRTHTGALVGRRQSGLHPKWSFFSFGIWVELGRTYIYI